MVPLDVPCVSPQGPWCFSYVLIPVGDVLTLVAVYYSTPVVLGYLVTGFISVCMIVVIPLKYVCIPYLPHIFLKLSDSHLVYGTTTYPTPDLSAVLEVFPVFVVLLFWSYEALCVMVTSGSMLWSCNIQLHGHHTFLKLFNMQISTFHLDSRMSVQFQHVVLKTC